MGIPVPAFSSPAPRRLPPPPRPPPPPPPPYSQVPFPFPSPLFISKSPDFFHQTVNGQSVQKKLFYFPAGLPEPIALYPLNEQYGAKDISQQKNPPGKATGVKLAHGYYGQPAGSFYFSGSSSSFVEFPNNGGLDARYSMTFAAWIHPENSAGPLFNYKVNDRGVYVWLESPNKLVAKFEIRDSSQPYAIQSDRIRLKMWNYVAATYDHSAGTARLWIDGKEVSRLNLGRFEISTQGDVRMGALVGDPNFYKGSIACVQIYNKSLSEQEINAVKDRCPIKGKIA